MSKLPRPFGIVAGDRGSAPSAKTFAQGMKNLPLALNEGCERKGELAVERRLIL